MKKKLVTFLVCLCLALGAASSITAFAGINTNTPTGYNGLIAGGGLDTKNYMLADAKTDAEKGAYEYELGNSTYVAGNKAYLGTKNPIPKATFSDKGGYFVTRFDLYTQSIGHGDQIAFGLGTSIVDSSFGFMYGGVSWSTWFSPIDNAFKEKSLYNYNDTTDLKDTTNQFVLGFGNENMKKHLTGDRKYVTYWIEINFAKPAPAAEESETDESEPATNPNLGDVKVYCGYVRHNADGTDTVEQKQEYGTVKGMFALPTADAYMHFLWNQDTDFEIDNYTTYRYGGIASDAEEVFSNHTFDTVNGVANTEIFKNVAGEAQKTGANVFHVSPNAASVENCYVKSYDSHITVTNPAEKSRIVSIKKLATDNLCATTFELDAEIKLLGIDTTGDDVRKVGVALGLYDEEEAIKDADDASFIYLTVNEDGNVVLGAQKIANGTATDVGTPAIVGKASVASTATVDEGDGEGTGETGTGEGEGEETPSEPEIAYVGETAPYISLHLVGRKDGSVDVYVNDAETPVNFPGLKVNGCVAIGHTGTGNATYRVNPDVFAVTGYQLTENEGEAVTSSFDGNYISEAKFEYRSNVAPSNHAVETETSLPITGLNPADGRLKFHGTSTNARIMFKDSYADFALQFDFISIPVKQRAALPGLGLGSAAGDKAWRNVSLYAMFGGEAPSSATTQFNLLGIVEGNQANSHWGAESVIFADGKLAGKLASGYTVGWRDATEDDDEDLLIPYYEGNAGDPVNKMPANENSFYGKTTRFKLIVVNNNIAMYAATIAEDGTVGDYRLVAKGKADNTVGYVGIGTESPAWCEIDNLAITPISSETALASELEFTPAADFVADVTEFAADTEPAPLTKPVVTVDGANKKVTWTAIEGAENYTVTVKRDVEVLKTQTVTATEFDMSAYTEEGDYTVTVTANSADLGLYKSSASTITYTVGKGGVVSGGDGSGSGDGSGGKGESGCGCGSSVGFSLGSVAFILLGCVALMLVSKRKSANK